MPFRIISIFVYLFSFTLAFLGLSSVQFEKFCNVKKPVQVQILLYALSMGLAYPIAQFANGDIFKMSKEKWASQIEYIRQVLKSIYEKNSAKDIASTGANLDVASVSANLDTLEALSEDFDNADVTIDYRQKFYDVLVAIKDQYLVIRDYLSAEVQKNIDAILSDEKVQNFGYFVECLYYMSKSERGFDLLVSEDGVNFDVITRDGMGDPYNHGCRVFAITDSGLCVGTANPFYGTQVWLIDDYALVGDLDFDGTVGILDATILQRHASGVAKLADDARSVADVDGDGKISVMDATYIQRELAGIGNDTADLLGDVDFNGVVNILDVTMIQRDLARVQILSPKAKAVADYNEDGEESILDATAIQRDLANL